MKYRVIYISGMYLLTKKNRVASESSIAATFHEIMAEVKIDEPKTVVELDASAITAIQAEG